MGISSVSAATVTLNSRGHVLLLNRADNGEWQIPGGVVELGENPPDAAVRETFEETGFRVAPIRLTGVYTHTVRGIIALVFLARVRGGSATPSAESTAVEWFSPADAASLVPEVFRLRLRDALAAQVESPVRGTSNVEFRTHDGQTMPGPHRGG